jgi:hypothetical protein
MVEQMFRPSTSGDSAGDVFDASYLMDGAERRSRSTAARTPRTWTSPAIMHRIAIADHVAAWAKRL